MENWNVFSQTVHFQKIAAGNSFELIASVQESGREMLMKTLEHCSWLPQNLKSECLSWTDSCLFTTARCKQLLDQGYEEAMQFLANPLCQDQPKMKNTKKAEKSHPITASPITPIAENIEAIPATDSVQPVIARKENYPDATISPAADDKPLPPVDETVATTAAEATTIPVTKTAEQQTVAPKQLAAPQNATSPARKTVKKTSSAATRATGGMAAKESAEHKMVAKKS